MSIVHYKGSQPAIPAPVPNAQRVGIYSPDRGDRTVLFDDGRNVEATFFEVQGTMLVLDRLVAAGGVLEPITRH